MNEIWNKYTVDLKSMNFSDQYIKSITEIVEKWIQTGLLKNIEDPHIMQCLSIILDNQRLFNESAPLTSFQESSYQDHKNYQIASIATARRIFDNSFIGYDLVSIQPSLAPSGLVYHIDKNEKMKDSQITCVTRFRKTTWESPTIIRDGVNNYFEFKGRKIAYGIDANAEAIIQFSEEMKKELSREIIDDLSNNAGKSHSCEYESVDQVLNIIDGISSYIAIQNQNKEANWVVLSPYMVKLLSDHIEFKEGLNSNFENDVRKIGILNGKWEVIEDTSYPREKILVGLKGKNHYFSGYFYSPYIFWNLNPNYRLNDEEPGWIMSRYGKKLINSEFYGLIRFENLPDVEQKEEAKQEGVENGV